MSLSPQITTWKGFCTADMYSIFADANWNFISASFRKLLLRNENKSSQRHFTCWWSWNKSSYLAAAYLCQKLSSWVNQHRQRMRGYSWPCRYIARSTTVSKLKWWSSLFMPTYSTFLPNLRCSYASSCKISCVVSVNRTLIKHHSQYTSDPSNILERSQLYQSQGLIMGVDCHHHCRFWMNTSVDNFSQTQFTDAKSVNVRNIWIWLLHLCSQLHDVADWRQPCVNVYKLQCETRLGMLSLRSVQNLQLLPFLMLRIALQPIIGRQLSKMRQWAKPE